MRKKLNWWMTNEDERPRIIRASDRPAYEPGQMVAVLTFDDPPRELHGELRAIDDGLAVVLIDGRAERVPADRIKPLTVNP